MIFLFGIKRNSIARIKLTSGSCPYCSNENTLIATKYGSYFHFFFIPIFPVGKSSTIECTHCYKSFDERNFTAGLQEAIKKETAFVEKKRPIWHGCGCIIMLPFILFIIIGTFFASGNETKEKESPFYKNYLDDSKKLTTKPDCKIDSISCAVKDYMDFIITDEINKDQFKYFSKVNNNKVLILLKIDDMKKIEPSVRKEFINLIHEGALQLHSLENKEFYIGVDGFWNTVLVSTPTHSDLDGRFADEKYLYEFYQGESKTSSTTLKK